MRRISYRMETGNVETILMGGRKRIGGRRTKARDATDLVRVHDLHVLTISLLLLSIVVVNY